MTKYTRDYGKVLRYSASEHAGFREAIANGDLTARKVYADYLDERPEEAAPGTAAILRHHEGPLDVVDRDGKTAVNFRKTVSPGLAPSGRRRARVTVHIEYQDGKLSLSGDHGGSRGQINMRFAHRDSKHNDNRYSAPIRAGAFKFDKSWTAKHWLDLLDIWKRWHLNDMRAGTPEQEQHLRENPVNAVYPQSHYDLACESLAKAGLNPHNGYSYGSKWLREEVPAEVLEQLAKLPSRS